MKRTLNIMLINLAMCLSPLVAEAAPLSAPRDATAKQDMIVQVHGCHRACVRAYVPRWGIVARHRHVGPGCYPRACGKRYNSLPPGWGDRGCFKLGPVWYCP